MKNDPRQSFIKIWPAHLSLLSKAIKHYIRFISREASGNCIFPERGLLRFSSSAKATHTLAISWHSLKGWTQRTATADPICADESNLLFKLCFHWLDLERTLHTPTQPKTTEYMAGGDWVVSYMLISENMQKLEKMKRNRSVDSSSIPHKSKIHIICVIENDSKYSCKVNYIAHPWKTAIKVSYVM